MKTIVILRGAAGSGKSSVASIISAGIGWITVSADNSFVDPVSGQYVFRADGLEAAHEACRKLFLEACKEPSIVGIVVDNTNSSEKEFGWYERAGKKAGAKIVFLVVENRHGGVNIHDCPQEAIDRQRQNIIKTLKV
jgi:predicted ABC-type ATPase